MRKVFIGRGECEADDFSKSNRSLQVNKIASAHVGCCSKHSRWVMFHNFSDFQEENSLYYFSSSIINNFFTDRVERFFQSHTLFTVIICFFSLWLSNYSVFLFRIVKRPRNPPPGTIPSSTVIYSWPVTSMVLQMREPGLICVVHSRSIFIQHCYRACDSFFFFFFISFFPPFIS